MFSHNQICAYKCKSFVLVVNGQIVSAAGIFLELRYALIRSLDSRHFALSFSLNGMHGCELSHHFRSVKHTHKHINALLNYTEYFTQL